MSSPSGVIPSFGQLLLPTESISRLLRPRRSTNDVVLTALPKPLPDVQPASATMTSSDDVNTSPDDIPEKERALSLDGMMSRDGVEDRARVMQHLWWQERQRQIDAKKGTRSDSVTSIDAKKGLRSDSVTSTHAMSLSEEEHPEGDYVELRIEPDDNDEEQTNGRTIIKVNIQEDEKDSTFSFAHLTRALTPEIIRRRRSRKAASSSDGDIMSSPDVSPNTARRQSTSGAQLAASGIGYIRDILRRRPGNSANNQRDRHSDGAHLGNKLMVNKSPKRHTAPPNIHEPPVPGHENLTKSSSHSGFGHIKKTLTPEIIRKRRGRRQASHGDVLSVPEMSSVSDDRRQSSPNIHSYHSDRLEQFKDILRRRRGRRQVSHGDIFRSHHQLCSLPEAESLDDMGRKDGMSKTQLSVDHGRPISELVEDVVMEHRLTSYRVHLASTKAILNLDADAMLLDGDEIILEDGDDDGHGDPRSESDVRLRIAYRMLKSEKRYQEALRSVFDVYAEPLRKFSSLTKEDHRILFFGLEPLLSLSATLALKLEDSIQHWDDITTVGNLFSKQFWHHYDEYYQNYKDIRNLLREKRDSDDEFVQFCQLRRGAALHSLDSLLLLPVQRIPAYAEYLSELLEDTERNHPDYEDLSKATAKVKSMVKDREEDLDLVENELKVETVQDRFPFDDLGLHDREKFMKMKALQSRRRSAPGAMILRTLSKKQGSGSASGLPPLLPDLANASKSAATNMNRIYVLEGPAQLTTGLQTQDRYLFLFNDLLLIAKQKSSTTFKLKQRTRVCEIWMAHCLDEVAETSRAADRSFVIGWPTTNTVATFTTADMRDLWYNKLKEQIASEKSKEHPKTVVLRVLNNDMEEYPTSKNIAVTNYEQAHEVVKRCLEEFHILDGKPKDYQLWVLSGKEESPYPLIGHEQPYSVKMSHVRDAALRGTGDDDPLDVDANDNSIQCQFVLRQAKKHPKATLDEPGIKRNKKSKKSPFTNLFKKSVKHDSTATPVAALGKLFGHPLCSVSEEDAPPKPVMAMMQQLFLNGPYTNGIFRKTANARCLREMREKLDNGEDVAWDDVPVLSIAGIFKEFLRSLPDCLMLSDMYDSWIDIVEIQDDQQKVDKIKKTLEQVHKPHVNLLRYTMCMLYHIEARSDTNQMNASNLAICIGQSLLFPPASSGTPNQTGTKKVSELMQFMIEHVVDVFGEDVTLLFGEVPETKPRQDSSTDSDSMHSLLSLADNNGARRDDSSLDSLDRDLYNSEIESSPRLKSHMSNTNLSRDSGLTLSDTQLYTDDCGSTGEGGECGFPRASPHKHHHQHNHYIRSVSSQLDHDRMTHNSADALSRSLDDPDHPPPVPPPRKNRRRGAETPPGEGTPPSPLAAGYVFMPGQHMRGHMMSGGQIVHPAYMQQHHAIGSGAMGRHHTARTADTLADLEDTTHAGNEEHDEATGATSAAEEYTEIQRIVHDQQHEDATLHKSESGACLFMDDEVVHRGLPSGLTHQPHSVSTTSVSSAGEDSFKQDPLSASFAGHPGSPLQSPVGMEQLSSSYPNMSSSQFSDHMHVAIPDHPPPPYNSNHKTIPVSAAVAPAATTSQSTREEEDDGEPAPPLPPRPTSLSLQTSNSDSNVGPSSSSGVSPAAHKILCSSQLVQKDPTVLRKVQKGMTPTGADIFPKHMRNMMRHSLQEDEMRRAAAAERAPVRKMASADPYTGSTHADRRQTLLHMGRNARSVEKSASDSSILDATYHQDTASSSSSPARKTSDNSVELRRRPDKPPSYQEAIKRKSLIQSGVLRYEASETELIQQRQNNQRARQLYEESMKKYEKMQKGSSEEREDNDDAALASHGQPSAHTEADQQVYETMTYVPEKAELDVHVSEDSAERRIHASHSNHSNSSSSSCSSNTSSSQSPPSEPRRKDSHYNHHHNNQACSEQQQQNMHVDNRDIQCAGENNNLLLSSSSSTRRSQLNAGSNNNVHRTQYSHSHDPPPSPPQTTSSAHSNSNNKRGGGESNTGDKSRESTPVRRNHSHERTPRDNRNHNNQNERPAKSRSKSREKRHGHRSSDTRLENSRHKEDREFRAAHRGSNLARSKSDSQEHLNKIGHFKELMPLDSNIIEKCKRAKIEDFRTSSDHVIHAVVDMREESRPKSQSVKNRDWHRELAEKYGQVFYQPTTVQLQTKAMPQYAYIKSTKQEANENERPKRRWTPPVHPTKDLIIIHHPDGEVRARKNTPPRTLVKSEHDFRNHGTQFENSRKQQQQQHLVVVGDNKENRPAVTSAESAVPIQAETDYRDQSKDFTMAEPDTISWSVARLRNLYSKGGSTTSSSSSEQQQAPDASKSSQGPFYNPDQDGSSRPPPPPYRHPPPASVRGSASQRRSPGSEKTNPEAEESYV